MHLSPWANAALSATTVATSSDTSLSTFTGYQMDSRLPSLFLMLPSLVEAVLLNWGINEISEVGVSLDEQTWIAQYGSIVEYVHDRFPNAKVFITYPWGVDLDVPAAVMHGWIDTVISEHAAYTFAGVDEAITIKAEDDGFLETDKSEGGSGIHYSALGADYYARDMAIILQPYYD